MPLRKVLLLCGSPPADVYWTASGDLSRQRPVIHCCMARLAISRPDATRSGVWAAWHSSGVAPKWIGITVRLFHAHISPLWLLFAGLSKNPSTIASEAVNMKKPSLSTEWSLQSGWPPRAP